MNEIQSLPFHLQLLVREYGQSTYQLIQGLRAIPDVADRTRRAAQIVQLMMRLRPALREQPDIQGKLWSHLSALLGEEIVLDSPVPLKTVSLRVTPPRPVPYPVHPPRLRAYGRVIESLIAKALTLEDPAEREQATIQIGRTMKFLYRQHNKENAKDVTILRHLGELSGGKLTLDPQVVDSEGLFEMAMPPAGNPKAFIVPQPRADGRNNDNRNTDRRNGQGGNQGGFGNGNNKQRNDKKRGKKGRQEPQQPPQ